MCRSTDCKIINNEIIELIVAVKKEIDEYTRTEKVVQVGTKYAGTKL